MKRKVKVGKIVFCLLLAGILSASPWTALAYPPAPEEEEEGSRYPNSNAKDMDGDIPWRVEDADTSIPVLWIIKDSDQALVEVDEMKYVVLYDVSDGYDPPGDWDSPLSDHVVYYHDFHDMEIDQDYWYWLTTTFENDGSYHGSQPNGTSFTASNLGYSEGDTISFTLRLYGKDGIWPFYTDVWLDQDFKVHVGEASLPSVSNWYWGDLHNHGWKTDNEYEYAEPTGAKALAAAAMGLSFVTITDHASDLTTSKWNDLGNECALYSTPTFRLIRAEEMHANQGGLLNVRHMLGYELTTHVEGDEDGTYTINEILGGPQPSNNLTAQGGFSYAAHPTDDSIYWSYSEMESALNYDTFIGLEFHNERNGYYSEDDWTDDDDEYHPWGGDDSIDPYNHDWTIQENNWDDFLLQGLSDWDHLMSDRLDPVRKIFMSGGSDAHGGWNYSAYMTMALDYVSKSSAMGKVRTAVYCPGGLSDGAILTGLREGRTIVTDGPAMVFGIDVDGDGDIYGLTDAIIGDGPIVVATDDPQARFRFTWSSSAEYGDVVCLRLFQGDSTTGENPLLVWEYHPYIHSGSVNGPLVAGLMPLVGETVYFRAVAYTYDPAGPAPPPGDVSNFSYDASVNDYNYRCFTNPIWVTAGAPTLVEMVSFTARAGTTSVALLWETASEVDTAGFHLWKKMQGEDEYTRITKGLIPRSGGDTWGASYEYVDEDVTFGRTYFYKLEDIDIYGISTFHGPVEATVDQVCGARTGTINDRLILWTLALFFPIAFLLLLTKTLRKKPFILP